MGIEKGSGMNDMKNNNKLIDFIELLMNIERRTNHEKDKLNESNNTSSGIDRGANGRLLNTGTIRKSERVRKS